MISTCVMVCLGLDWCLHGVVMRRKTTCTCACAHATRKKTHPLPHPHLSKTKKDTAPRQKKATHHVQVDLLLLARALRAALAAAAAAHRQHGVGDNVGQLVRQRGVQLGAEARARDEAQRGAVRGVQGLLERVEVRQQRLFGGVKALCGFVVVVVVAGWLVWESLSSVCVAHKMGTSCHHIIVSAHTS
jgi:hypothetical protein